MRERWILPVALLGLTVLVSGASAELGSEAAAGGRAAPASRVASAGGAASADGAAPAIGAAPAAPAVPPGGAAPAAASGELQQVTELIPDAILDLRYATDDNFMKEAVYPKEATCLLRPKTAARLAKVADRLRREDGTRLVLYDCYRPLSVQRRMWEVFPVRGYVAPPSGGSIHNRGAAVDLGLASSAGEPLPMPSGFDEFTKRAWHAYEGGTAEERRNRGRLRDAMRAEGFTTIRKEWWHYEDPQERRAPLLDLPFVGNDEGSRKLRGSDDARPSSGAPGDGSAKAGGERSRGL